MAKITTIAVKPEGDDGTEELDSTDGDPKVNHIYNRRTDCGSCVKGIEVWWVSGRGMLYGRREDYGGSK